MATLTEIKKHFAYNQTRLRLVDALRKVVTMLEKCECMYIYLDGSFITSKAEPKDYDLVWEPTGIVPTKELKEFLKERDRRKEKYLGDIIVRYPEPPFHFDHFYQWQMDKDGNAKGIICIVVK